MTDDIAFLDDATRPQPPRLENLTARQRAPGRHLRMIHDHLRGSIDELGAMIEAIAAGEGDVGAVAERAAALPALENYRRFGNLCGQYCLFVNSHHSIEDQALFPVLSTKSEALARIAARLKAEHDIVHALLLRLVEALNDLASDPRPETFARARAEFERLRGILLSHLDYEEDAIGDALGYYEVMV